MYSAGGTADLVTLTEEILNGKFIFCEVDALHGIVSINQTEQTYKG